MSPSTGTAARVEPIAAAGLSVAPASAVWTSGDGDVNVPRPVGRRSPAGAASPRLAGTLVHRMLQQALDPDGTDGDLTAAAEALLTPLERVDVVDAAAVVDQAVDVYRSLWRDASTADLLAGGERYHEVPFSYFPPDQPGVCLRGSVDCLLSLPGGRLVVLEVKTGRARPEHEVQLALYVAAMQAAFPDAEVAGRLWYPSAP